MYLFHVPVIGFLRRVLPWLSERPAFLFPAAMLVSFVLATLSYRHLEAPLLALKERFRPARQTGTESVASLELAPRQLTGTHLASPPARYQDELRLD
jgi:peptidoglycan/LPS O-acetylase OafA/YrhL